MQPSDTAITEEQFRAYEAVRTSGETNMFDLSAVCFLSGLSKAEVFAIMKQYRSLCERFPGIRH